VANTAANLLAKCRPAGADRGVETAAAYKAINNPRIFNSFGQHCGLHTRDVNGNPRRPQIGDNVMVQPSIAFAY